MVDTEAYNVPSHKSLVLMEINMKVTDDFLTEQFLLVIGGLETPYELQHNEEYSQLPYQSHNSIRITESLT